ncbi:MAG: hypothetical protein JKY52_11865 [Flavobacteriales bacterium]|nr:hypothetical protein [Flavobacteriales bacterium]
MSISKHTTSHSQNFYTKLLSLTLLCMFAMYTSKAGDSPVQPDKTIAATTNNDTLCEVYLTDSVPDGVDLRNIGSNTLVEFKVRLINGKAYTQWQVKGERDDGLFIIECSTDGKNYKQIGFKQGVGVPIYTPILYCWIDENPMSKKGFYRLAKVYQDGRYYYSDAVGLSKDPLIKPIEREKPSLIAIQE